MISIAICDDNKALLEVISHKIKQVYLSLNINIILSLFNNGEDLLKEHEQNHFNAIFLDINMPNENGFNIAEKIRKIPVKTYIIFVTSTDELVYQSFEYQPFYFIRKKNIEYLNSEIEKVIYKLNRFINKNDCIIVDDYDMGNLTISYNNILYFKSDNHYLLIYTKKYDKPIRIRGNLKEKEEELITKDFVRTHKQYLINLCNTQKINVCSNTVFMTNKEQLPISKKYKDNFYSRYKNFLRENI